jgi:hypothetical protein
VEKMSLKKDLTFDFVLLFIDETLCLSYYPPKFMIMFWFIFYLFLRKGGHIDLETHLIDLIYFSSLYHFMF